MMIIIMSMMVIILFLCLLLLLLLLLYIYMHIIDIYAYAYIYICIYIFMCIYIYCIYMIFIYGCIYIYIYMYIYIYIYLYIDTYIYIIIYIHTYINIWANYNDLTATSLESWLIREIIPKWPSFRLVNYFLFTYIYIYACTHIYIYTYLYMSWNQYLFVRTCWDHFGKHCKYLQSYWKHFETMVMFDSHHPPCSHGSTLRTHECNGYRWPKKMWVPGCQLSTQKTWNPTNVWMKCSEL